VTAKPLLNERPQVVLVSMFYAPVMGGIEIHVHHLARSLLTMGSDVRVACVGKTPCGESLPTGDFQIDGISVRRLRGASFGSNVIPLERIRGLGVGGVVHLHGLARPMLMRAVQAADGRPLVVTPHGVDGLLEDASALRRFIKRGFDRAVLGRLAKHVDAFICIKEQERSLLVDQFGVDHDRVRVIPNPIDDMFFDESTSISRRIPWSQSDDGHGSGRLLMFGRIARIKRIPDMLAALGTAGDLPDCDVVGPPDDDSQRVVSLASALAPGRVRIKSPVDGLERYRLLADAHALVICSSREGLPTVALEAIAVGTPLVVSKTAAGGLPAGTFVGFESGDVRGLVRAVRACGDPVVRARLAGAMDEARKDLLKPMQHASRIMDVYGEVSRRAAGFVDGDV